MDFVVPAQILNIMETLQAAGWQVYLVGGCVRDMLLGLSPSDWDLTTDEPPEVTLSIFGGAALPTGLTHGTVTVRCGGMSAGGEGVRSPRARKF